MFHYMWNLSDITNKADLLVWYIVILCENVSVILIHVCVGWCVCTTITNNSISLARHIRDLCELDCSFKYAGSFPVQQEDARPRKKFQVTDRSLMDFIHNGRVMCSLNIFFFVSLNKLLNMQLNACKLRRQGHLTSLGWWLLKGAWDPVVPVLGWGGNDLLFGDTKPLHEALLNFHFCDFLAFAWGHHSVMSLKAVLYMHCHTSRD